MYLDRLLMYSENQAITNSAPSTNVIDHGPLSGNSITRLGTGERVEIVVIVTVAMTDAGNDSTVTPAFQTDDNETFTSPTTVLTLGTFGALSSVGTIRNLTIPVLSNIERYTRINYTVANGALTTGSFTAFLTNDLQAWRAYADAITIS